MPLTIAHPAAVVPLRNSGLPFSALLVGSLAPDLEYLFHLSPTGQFGHTIPGLFLFCIPIGLLSLLIFHWIWSPPSDVLMNRAGSKFSFLPFSHFGLICLSILIGAISHLVWDSLTHSYGWMVQRVSPLRMPLMETPWGTLRLFKVLQHSSTALGLAILGILLLPTLRALPSRVWKILAILVGTSIAGGAFIGLMKAGMPSDFEAVRVFTGIAVVGSFAVFVAETTFVATIWKAKNKTV